MYSDTRWGCSGSGSRWSRSTSTHRSSRSAGAGVRDRSRLLGLTALVTCLAIGIGATGAARAAGVNADATPKAPVNYVALGDSYSSGVGAGDYDPGASDCKRSANAYSSLWAKELSKEPVAKFTFVACSGAKTADVESNQLGALSSETTLVTMTIGGNDVGFAPTVAQCLITGLFAEQLCINAVVAAGKQASNSMPAVLGSLYKQIKEKAPNAKVLILGYPHIFETGDCGAFGFSDSVRSAINESTSVLNGVIKKVASANGFTYIDGEQAFRGRGLCTTAAGGAWLTDASAGSELYHPNQDGQRAYAVALDAGVRGADQS